MSTPNPERRRRRGLLDRVPLKLSVPIGVALPAALLSVVLFTIAYLSGRYSTERLASQNIEQIHSRVHERLRDFLDTPRRVANLNLALIREGKLPLDDLRGWRQLLFDQARAFDTLSCIEWGDTQGRVVWFARYPGSEAIEFGIKDELTGDSVREFIFLDDGELQTPPAGAYPYDPRERPWYRAALAADGPAWTQPFGWVHRDGSEVALGMGYTQAVRAADGDLLGVLDVELTLHELSHFLRTLRVGRTGGAFIVDRSGNLIAASSSVPMTDAALRPLAAVAGADPLIAVPAERVLARVGSFAALRDDYEDVIDVGGERARMRVTPFEHGTGLSWYVATVVPELDFLADVQAGRQRSILIGVLAIVLLLALGVVLAVLMTRPMLALAAHAQRIGQGNLDEDIHLRGAPELVKLSRELNRMTAGLRDRLRMRQSLAMAMEVQKCLLPAQTPAIEGLDVAGHSTYCDETGGDYYDYLDVAGLSDTTAVVAVGDVVGHGVAAAMLMATARGILRSRCQETGSLADLLTHMNAHLARDVGAGTGRFMTMLLMTIDAARHELRWASAGHDPPLLYDPQEDRFLELHGGGLPLGILEEEQYEEQTHGAIKAGQICFVGTDGVWEAANDAGQMFGKERIMELIRGRAGDSADEISAALRELLVDFRGGVRQADDVTFVILKVL